MWVWEEHVVSHFTFYPNNILSRAHCLSSSNSNKAKIMSRTGQLHFPPSRGFPVCMVALFLQKWEHFWVQSVTHTLTLSNTQTNTRRPHMNKESVFVLAKPWTCQHILTHSLRHPTAYCTCVCVSQRKSHRAEQEVWNTASEFPCALHLLWRE